MGNPVKWTGAEVKKRLPRVDVKLQDRIRRGNVSGRRNKFATVWIEYYGNIYEAQYSWAAVARALNTKKPLKVA